MIFRLHISLALNPQEYNISKTHLSLRPNNSLSVFSDCKNIFFISSRVKISGKTLGILGVKTPLSGLFLIIFLSSKKMKYEESEENFLLIDLGDNFFLERCLKKAFV